MKRVILGVIAMLMAALLSPSSAQAGPATSSVATAAGTCNYYDNPGTWPLCELWSNPISVPRFDVGSYWDPRPNLTPKTNQWCTKRLIGENSYAGPGYIYWNNWNVIKHDLRLWPDYYERWYTLQYWNGEEWIWAQKVAGYPPVTKKIYCDA